MYAMPSGANSRPATPVIVRIGTNTSTTANVA